MLVPTHHPDQGWYFMRILRRVHSLRLVNWRGDLFKVKSIKIGRHKASQSGLDCKVTRPSSEKCLERHCLAVLLPGTCTIAVFLRKVLLDGQGLTSTELAKSASMTSKNL